MTIYDLNKHFRTVQKMQKLKAMIDSIRETSSLKSPSLDGMPRGTGISDKVGELAIELADLDARLNHIESGADADRANIDAWTNTIDDDTTRLVFRLRYLRGLTWGEVAKVIGGGNTSDGVRMMCYRYFERNRG